MEFPGVAFMSRHPHQPQHFAVPSGMSVMKSHTVQGLAGFAVCGNASSLRWWSAQILVVRIVNATYSWKDKKDLILEPDTRDRNRFRLC